MCQIDVFFGKLLQENSTNKKVHIDYTHTSTYMAQKEEWCRGSLRIFIDSKPPPSSSSTPIKDWRKEEQTEARKGGAKRQKTRCPNNRMVT